MLKLTLTMAVHLLLLFQFVFMLLACFYVFVFAPACMSDCYIDLCVFKCVSVCVSLSLSHSFSLSFSISHLSLPLSALTQSTLVIRLTIFPEMEMTSSPSDKYPQVHFVLAEGLLGAQLWTNNRWTTSEALAPPSNRRPSPSLSPGSR